MPQRRESHRSVVRTEDHSVLNIAGHHFLHLLCLYGGPGASGQAAGTVCGNMSIFWHIIWLAARLPGLTGVPLGYLAAAMSPSDSPCFHAPHRARTRGAPPSYPAPPPLIAVIAPQVGLPQLAGSSLVPSSNFRRGNSSPGGLPAALA